MCQANSCFIPSSLVGWACQWMWNTQSLQYSRLIPKDATEYQVTLRSVLRNMRNNEKIFLFSSSILLSSLFLPSSLPLSLFPSPFPSLPSLPHSLPPLVTPPSAFFFLLFPISVIYFFTLHSLKM